MADSNLEYWRKREQAQLEANLREEETYSARLDAQFALLERTIDQLIADFYQRYATAEGISLADAQQKISKADIDALAEKAKRYVELASQDRRTGSNQAAEYLSKMANDEMRLYNAMMRINRLELLKAEIGMEVDQTYLQMGGTMNTALTKRTDDELRRQSGILGSTVFHNKEDVAAIVNGSFHNATFDQYIWKDCTALKSNLDVLLTQGLIAGDNPRELARRLRKTFTASRYEAERLMRTELARVQTDAQKMSYERNGYDKYMFISTEDSHTCERCSGKERECIEKDGFAVEDMEIGENAPPMHPNCRCSTAAHVSEADFEREMMEKFGIDMRDHPGRNMSDSGRHTKMVETPPVGKALSEEDKKELLRFAKEHRINIHGINKFDGDINLVKEYITELTSHSREFPRVFSGKRITLKFDDLSVGNYAITEGKVTTMNRLYTRDKAFTEASMKDSGWFANPTIGGMARHEMGHIVESVHGEKGLAFAQQVYYNIHGKHISAENIIDFIHGEVSFYAFPQVVNEITGDIGYSEHEITSEILASDKDTRFINEMKELWRKEGQK